MKHSFHFKQFTIHQDRCAMKVGTDGVLLGAWTSLETKPHSILDIGAGTGLIALQMAQRSTADLIDAIELNDHAYEQCVENFEASPWSDRLFCYHTSFQEFYGEIDETYDLIVSNPPFYAEEISVGNLQREMARQNRALPFDELLKGVSKLLSKEGSFSVVLPHKDEQNFLKLASEQQLFPNLLLWVKGNPSSEIKRSYIQLSRNKTQVATEELIIEKERHQYTEKYIALTKAFYIKM